MEPLNLRVIEKASDMINKWNQWRRRREENEQIANEKKRKENSMLSVQKNVKFKASYADSYQCGNNFLQSSNLKRQMYRRETKWWGNFSILFSRISGERDLMSWGQIVQNSGKVSAWIDFFSKIHNQNYAKKTFKECNKNFTLKAILKLNTKRFMLERKTTESMHLECITIFDITNHLCFPLTSLLSLASFSSLLY